MGAFEIRRAEPSDVDEIALAHRDSIQSIGSAFYPPEVVDSGQLYLNASVPPFSRRPKRRDLQRSGEHRSRGLARGSRFLRANGFVEVGRGEARLTTGRSMAGVFMRKHLSAATP